MGEEKKKKRKRKILGRVKLRTLFLLVITIDSNSFAWFIYTTKVSSSITAKVREWNVTFDINGAVVEKIIEMNVDSLYPGMPTYSQTLTASNSGGAKAEITYEIVKADVLGTDLMALGYDNNHLFNYLANNYPFSITLTVSNPIINLHSEENITISVSWPYESGDDETDTYWGTEAHAFHTANPDTPSISLIIKITAYQINE